MNPVQIERMIDVLQDVKRERYRQFDEWGNQDYPIAQWALILNEEVGEVNKEICENHFSSLVSSDSDNLRKELIQVATVAVQMVEWLDLQKKK